MKRVLTATCLAATFAVGLAAQSTGTAAARRRRRRIRRHLADSAAADPGL